MGYLALISGRYGWRSGMATVAGVTLGLAAYLIAAVFGIGEAAARWPWLLQGLKWAGVAYLVWLAVDTWRGRDGVVAAAEPERRRLFMRGLLTNLLNPKAAVFYVALLPAFIRQDAGSPAGQVIALGSIHLAVSLVVHGSIIIMASRAKPALDAWNAGSGRGLLQKAFAVGILMVAAWVGLTTRA